MTVCELCVLWPPSRDHVLLVLLSPLVPNRQFLLVSRETRGEAAVEAARDALGCSSGCSGSSLLRIEGGTVLTTPSTSSHSPTIQLTSSGLSPGASCRGLGLGFGLG